MTRIYLTVSAPLEVILAALDTQAPCPNRASDGYRCARPLGHDGYCYSREQS